LITWVGASVILFVANGIWLKVLAPVILSLIGYSLASRRRHLSEKQDENVELNKSLGLALQGQGMLDMAFEKFLKCPIEDQAVQKLMYNLGLDFERKRMTSKALSVYRHILKAGAFKDVKERLSKLISLESTLSMSAAAAKKETTFLLQNGAAKPTLGRYEILQELGQGAMGTVYLGRDPSINREVAVKTVAYADIAADELSDVKARFFREAEAAGKLSHPNIVTIYDMGEDHDMAYIAMELLKGNELTHYCRKGNLLPVKRVLKLVGAVAEALGYAHSQEVVHRDIKPANIILVEDDQVKVADFGIARVMSSSNTQTGVIFGTPNYMSPEQVAGKKVDGRSDLFSLGVVFYELLTGEKPFKGDSMTALLYAVSNTEYVPLKEVAPKTPPGCVEIVEKLLAKGVSKRYQTAAPVIKDIQVCMETIG
jgi:serine/threonine-protein kinase